jgi:hypothetical protein
MLCGVASAEVIYRTATDEALSVLLYLGKTGRRKAFVRTTSNSNEIDDTCTNERIIICPVFVI